MSVRTSAYSVTNGAAEAGAFPGWARAVVGNDHVDRVAELRQELRRSEARWRGVVHASPDGIVELDRLGRVALANPAAAQLFGLTVADMAGVELQALIHMRPSASSGELEARVATAEGERVLEVRLIPMEDGYIATLCDVTSSRLMHRKQSALSEAVRRSGVSPGLPFARLVRASEDERARMAAEVHDGPVQSLTSMTLRLDTVRDLVAAGRSEEADRVLLSMRTQVAEEIASLRRFMVDLRPPALDTHGLREALLQHGRRFQAETGIAFHLDGDGGARLPTTHEIVVLRIVQEALVNVAKHASARRVFVTLHIVGVGRSRVEVRDDGVGFVPQEIDPRLGVRFGLVGMRERAEMIGASLEVDSRPGHGTRVVVRFGRRLPEYGSLVG